MAPISAPDRYSIPSTRKTLMIYARELGVLPKRWERTKRLRARIIERISMQLRAGSIAELTFLAEQAIGWGARVSDQTVHYARRAPDEPFRVIFVLDEPIWRRAFFLARGDRRRVREALEGHIAAGCILEVR